MTFTKSNRKLLQASIGVLTVAAALSVAAPEQASALCDNSIDPNGANCLANGDSLFDFDELNFAIGFVNGSGNANSGALSGGGGPEVHIQAFNAWLGAANGSGNGNVVFGPGLAVNIAALNFEAGLANGAGNANVILADDNNCWRKEQTDNVDAEKRRDECDSAINIQAANTYFGVLNGALNGNNIGTGDAFVLQAENFAHGIGNFAGNANVVGNCEVVRNPYPTSDADPNFQSPYEVVKGDGVSYGPAFGPEGQGQSLRLRCDQTGDSKAIIVNNQAFGNLNGTGNANVLNAGRHDSSNLIMVNNHLFGDGNASGNGNAIGADSNAVIVNNSVTGEASASGNANALGGGDSNAEIINNNIQGVASLSGNGNSLGGAQSVPVALDAVEGDGLQEGSGRRPPVANAYLFNNRVVGSGSATANGNGGTTGNAVLISNTVIGDGSASNNGNEVLGDCGPDGGGGGGGMETGAEARLVDNGPCRGNGSAELIHNTVIGDGSLSNNTDIQNDGTFTAKNNQIIGSASANNVGDEFNNNFIAGDNSGNNAGRNVQNNTVIGDGSGNGYGDGSTGNLAIGNNSGNNVTGSDNIAVGTGAGNGVTGQNSISVGTNANAIGTDDTAIGARATVTADHSTALGADAVAYLPNQFVMGTKQDTYQAPGITSGLSKSRQSGPLEVVTSDAEGNLATDSGEIFRRLDNGERRNDEQELGIALAISMENPDLTGNERFGVAMNYGNFEGANALSWTFAGVIAHDLLTSGDRFAVGGGFGVGFAEGRYGDDVWGGRVGAQWTWGHKPVAYAAPLK